MKSFLVKILLPLIKLYWRIFKPKTYGSRAIILHGNKILLVKNIGSQHWSLPGGKLESEENPEQCIKRELKEELNLNSIEIEYKLGDYTTNKEGKRDTVYIFIIKTPTLIFEKQWELEDSAWFSLDELPQDISPAGLRRIKEYQTGAKNIFAEW